MDGKEIMRALNALYDACNQIENDGNCDNCPIRSLCDDGRIPGFIEWIDETDIFKMLTMSKALTNEDVDAIYADNQRKMAIEEEMIDREYGE